MEGQSLYILTGASKGLGEALKNLLLKLPNTRVIGISRSPLQPEDNFIPLQIDLSDTNSLIDKLHEIFPFGNYDKVVLINNAGWIGEIAYNGNISPMAIKTIHSVNVIAPAILMNAFMRKYKNNKGTKVVVNVSSGAAAKVVDGWSGYSSSKAALNQMTLIAQEESDLKDQGFKLFALSPGIIDTPMQESIRAASEIDFSGLSKFKSFKDNGDLSTPEEVADKVLYLIENPSKFESVLQDVRKF
ncbi:SDR family NAD(P)-dependent oxidoreductase [Cyclobacterium qasimii]|uniref:Short-chain alcohol dehydrogenase/reductase n=2 Tax=Cyclobacterium qasimii TaxID=1350429 RepID=S7WX72_9BACT|nr:SDR family NAD(P)-dependent oxidoreductase [Cyclobacterium qasimii]EPR68583.1 short-chain alcohol dehydrogenase/reductase [Cyclobacterium qasimii M12-11B]GEO20623.1 benzil reductase ((S)-benzoin forming) [Cyclobacterium qasimii]